jgi:poly(3-hydroxybutyrate) depolymerase
MSAGGALAAALGVRRPELVAGVFIHSGVACGAASSALAALNVLKRGADTDVAAVARAARARAAPRSLPVPLLAVQGADDDVVAPVNAAQLVRQYLVLNAHPAGDSGAYDALPPPDYVNVETLPDGRIVTTSEWRVADRAVARHVLVGGLGHAWSGGDDRHPYNDPRAPDATALLAAFVRHAMQSDHRNAEKRGSTAGNRTARDSTWRPRDSTISRSSPTTCRRPCSSTATCSA